MAAKNTVELRLDIPRVSIVLTEELQKVWNEIQFHEESKQYDLYDAAWEKFLKLSHDEIMDQIADDYWVSDASENRG